LRLRYLHTEGEPVFQEARVRAGDELQGPLDIDRCECGGKLKIITAIKEPALIERILTHLGFSAQPPPRSPARRVGLFHAA